MATESLPFTIHEGGTMPVGAVTIRIVSAQNGILHGEIVTQKHKEVSVQGRLRQERRMRRAAKKDRSKKPDS